MRECWSTQKGLYWQIITLEKAPKIIGRKVSFQAKSSFFRPKTVSRLQNQMYPENSSSPNLCVELSKETRVCMEQRNSCSVVGREGIISNLKEAVGQFVPWEFCEGKGGVCTCHKPQTPGE